MIRILYVISTLRRCGPTQVMWNIIKTLDRTQFDIQIATLSPEGNDSIIGEARDQGIKVHQLNCGKLWPVTSIWKLRQLVKECKPDVIHSHGVRPDLIAAFAGKSVKVSTLHNVPKEVYQQKYGRLYGKIMTFLQQCALYFIDYPVSCSKAVRTAWQRDCEISSKVVVNGIDISKSNLSPKCREAARYKLGISDHAVVFISTGGLSAWKHPEFIVKAFRESRRGEQGFLYLCGVGDKLEACKKLAGDAKNIIFTGQVQNVTEYLLAADYYVSASELEGMPNAVLEAMALELPVILSKIAAHREMLVQDKEAGWLFSLTDSRELTKILNDLCDERKKAGERARLLVLRYYSSEIMGGRYAKLYKKATGKEAGYSAKASFNCG